MTQAIAEYALQIPSKTAAGEFFVFFAGDLIPSELKSQEEFLRPGGILRTNYLSLEPHRGFIRQGEITQLRPQMQSEATTNVMPTERKHMIRTYSIIENGREKLCGVIKGDDGKYVWDGLFRIQFFPVDEVDRLCAPAERYRQDALLDRSGSGRRAILFVPELGSGSFGRRLVARAHERPQSAFQ
jgi:hypothetical protein